MKQRLMKIPVLDKTALQLDAPQPDTLPPIQKKYGLNNCSNIDAIKDFQHPTVECTKYTEASFKLGSFGKVYNIDQNKVEKQSNMFQLDDVKVNNVDDNFENCNIVNKYIKLQMAEIPNIYKYLNTMRTLDLTDNLFKYYVKNEKNELIELSEITNITTVPLSHNSCTDDTNLQHLATAKVNIIYFMENLTAQNFFSLHDKLEHLLVKPMQADDRLTAVPAKTAEPAVSTHFSEPEAYRIIFQILFIVYKINNYKCIHGDLHIGNIFIRINPDGTFTVKFIDNGTFTSVPDYYAFREFYIVVKNLMNIFQYLNDVYMFLRQWRILFNQFSIKFFPKNIHDSYYQYNIQIKTGGYCRTESWEELNPILTEQDKGNVSILSNPTELISWLCYYLLICIYYKYHKLTQLEQPEQQIYEHLSLTLAMFIQIPHTQLVLPPIKLKTLDIKTPQTVTTDKQITADTPRHLYEILSFSPISGGSKNKYYKKYLKYKHKYLNIKNK